MVLRVIPKNYFDGYANSKQKKMFTDLISRITWQSKISTETTNLESRLITEIQVFLVELKTKQDISMLLRIIDKAIPYNIIFVVKYQDLIYLSTSVKHPHPIDQNNAVIDWTFSTDWFLSESNKYNINLSGSLDSAYQDFCAQLTGKIDIKKKTLEELVTHNREKETLEKEILRLQKSIKSCQQFNRKVELNITLKQKQEALRVLTSK